MPRENRDEIIRISLYVLSGSVILTCDGGGGKLKGPQVVLDSRLSHTHAL